VPRSWVGVHRYVAFAQGGAAFGAYHQVGIGIYDGLSLQIGALELVAMAHRSRAQGKGYRYTGMQANTFQGGAAFQGMLEVAHARCPVVRVG